MSPVIAIVGRPNVGKSTLFNRISRSKNALVDDRPGITRDRLYATALFEGIPFTVVDTGGFDDIGDDPLQQKMSDQIKKAIDESDRIIFMVDGRQGLMPGDSEIAGILRRSRKNIFVAANKIDSPEHDHLSLDFYSLGLGPVYPVSASHGYGLASLMKALTSDLPLSGDIKADNNKIRIAVLGKPNAGKSSLINRITGTDRLLVSDLPGTTRDAVDILFSRRGKDYMLIDTAGIKKKAKVKEKIEKFSMIKALKSIDRCDIAVILIDATQGVTDQDARICGYAFEQARGIVLAVNKWDLVKGNSREIKLLNSEIDRQLNFITFAPRINLSALTGERVMKIFEKIDPLYMQFSQRIPTSSVNTALQQMIEKHPPPKTGRGRLKFLYATQAGTKPPTFIVFVNRPDMIHFSYERFLVNQIRKHFQLELSPIRLKFKKNTEKGNQDKKTIAVS
ncbi:MAG: ribosome biogenesis GTPase Der [Deltaproteobacteria bacterium]|nr:ribosome biogenesis GTPase Der [Deltaproteobacteria bacterium]